MKRQIFASAMAAVWMGTACAWGATATADIRGTATDSPIKGTVTLEDVQAGLHVKAQLVNVPPGPHGFHIHEYGDCGDMGKAAGNHFNPTGAPHGMVMKDGLNKAHAGDMGNITADKSGGATLDALIPGVKVADGPFTVGGRAIILHEKADDFSQPAGNAGGRIGCGLIRLTSTSSK